MVTGSLIKGTKKQGTKEKNAGWARPESGFGREANNGDTVNISDTERLPYCFCCQFLLYAGCRFNLQESGKAGKLRWLFDEKKLMCYYINIE